MIPIHRSFLELLPSGEKEDPLSPFPVTKLGGVRFDTGLQFTLTNRQHPSSIGDYLIDTSLVEGWRK
jgi:hypothetical protein